MSHLRLLSSPVRCRIEANSGASAHVLAKSRLASMRAMVLRTAANFVYNRGGNSPSLDGESAEGKDGLYQGQAR